MSALPPKADIERHDCHVCFVPKADKCTKRRARGCRESEPPNANDRLMGSVPRDKPSRRAISGSRWLYLPAARVRMAAINWVVV